jgi:tetratricopeptide (TPR) repeat protein
MKKYCLVYIFLCAVFIQSNKAQINTFYEKGDSCFQIQQFELAQIYYSRAAFQESDLNKQTFILFKKAEALLKSQNTKKAQQVLAGIALTDLTDSLRQEVLFKHAMYAYFNQDLSECEAKLSLLEMIYPLQKNTSRAKILHLFLLNEKGEYQKARDLLLDDISNNEQLNADEKLTQLRMADSIYTYKNVPKLKDIEKAITLNSATPGFGYFYAGYLGEGIANSLIQISSLGLSVFAVIQGFYATGLIAPFTIYKYFHVGSVKRIEYLIEKENYKKKSKFNVSIKNKIVQLLK